MAYEFLRVEIEAGAVLVTLNRPDKLNAFTPAMHAELRAALAALPAQGARVLTLTGAGRAFCAGQDLGERSGADGPPDLGLSIERDYNPLVRTLAALPMPVIAAVNGVAAGAGANLALACDLVIAAESASFIQSFAKLGLVPDSGGTWFLPRRIGEARALALALTGERLSAREAEAWGLIWRVVPDAEFEETHRTLAKRLAAGPTEGYARTKALLRAGATASLEESLAAECEAQRALGASADYREGVQAFLEKRAARFQGR
jgi:2-(1,2-epoxy-1,2-dihydrophenyl)acetyl-CoA isomerase